MRRMVTLTALLLAAAGCTSNTLKQELTYTAWQNCQFEGRIPAHAQLTRVDPDGTYWLFGLAGSHGFADAQKCMNDQFAKMKQAPPGVSTMAAAASTGPIGAEGAPKPDWKVGDEWAYRQESPNGAVTFFWSIDSIDRIANAEHYVMKSGRLSIYFRVTDVAVVLEKNSGDEIVRYTPGWTLYSWPLTVGTKWEAQYTEERVKDPQTNEYTRSYEALSEETVTVPAGTFRTIHIVCRNRRTGALVYDQWYSPAVKQIVRDVWPQQGGARTRELIAYKVK